jgi:hypothetical protein
MCKPGPADRHAGIFARPPLPAPGRANCPTVPDRCALPKKADPGSVKDGSAKTKEPLKITASHPPDRLQPDQGPNPISAKKDQIRAVFGRFGPKKSQNPPIWGNP